jgi:hypothetical protein
VQVAHPFGIGAERAPEASAPGLSWSRASSREHAARGQVGRGTSSRSPHTPGSRHRNDDHRIARLFGLFFDAAFSKSSLRQVDEAVSLRRPCSRACRARSRVVPQFSSFAFPQASDVSHALASMVTVGSLPERKRATPRSIGRASVTAKSRLSDSRAGGSLIGKSLLETRAVPQFGQRHCCRLQIVPRVNEPATQSSRGAKVQACRTLQLQIVGFQLPDRLRRSPTQAKATPRPSATRQADQGDRARAGGAACSAAQAGAAAGAPEGDLWRWTVSRSPPMPSTSAAWQLAGKNRLAAIEAELEGLRRGAKFGADWTGTLWDGQA